MANIFLETSIVLLLNIVVSPATVRQAHMYYFNIILQIIASSKAGCRRYAQIVAAVGLFDQRLLHVFEAGMRSKLLKRNVSCW
jgi:hypothetical protein